MPFRTGADGCKRAMRRRTSQHRTVRDGAHLLRVMSWSRTVVGAGCLAMIGLTMLLGCGQEVKSAKTGKVKYLKTMSEARQALGEVRVSSRPAIYVISAPWCVYCRALERALLKYNDGSRQIYISDVDPGSTKLIQTANAIFGGVLPQKVIPSTIITHYDGTTVFVQGYNGDREQFNNATRFDGTKTGPIPIRSLFEGGGRHD